MNTLRNLICAYICLMVLPLAAQNITCTQQDKAHCQATLNALASLEASSMGAAATKIGKLFLQTPYVAKTLEVNGAEEKLVVNLQGLDCTTFLENVVVFAQLWQTQHLTFEAYTQALQHLRYRNGELDGYPSRLHYFSEWIANNAAKGIISDITQALGGVPYTKAINFMSTHRKSYPSLANDDYYSDIQQREEWLNQQPRYFIPKENIAAVEQQIEEGDLIALTTSINGLDISHVGIATWQNGRLHLLHASSAQKEVVITDQPLAEYIQSVKSQSGIMVMRLQPIE